MSRQPLIYIVIPAYNEEKVIKSVLEDLISYGYKNIVVVDDGSKDNTYKEAKKVEGVVVLKHILNRGKGAAVKTGIAAAQILNADIIVTMDGDGQHDPEDITKLVSPIQNNNIDVTLGTRLTDTKGMPKHRIVANKLGNYLTWMAYGLKVTDSQSGFRAYSKKAASYIETRGDRYEYDSEVIREIKRHKLKFKEVPIKVRYTEYSMGKQHKQGVVNGIKTVYAMFWSLLS